MQALKRGNTIGEQSNQLKQDPKRCSPAWPGYLPETTTVFGPPRSPEFPPGTAPRTPVKILPWPGKDGARHNQLPVKIVLRINSNYHLSPTEAHEGCAPPCATSIPTTPTCAFRRLHTVCKASTATTMTIPSIWPRDSH